MTVVSAGPTCTTTANEPPLPCTGQPRVTAAAIQRTAFARWMCSELLRSPPRRPLADRAEKPSTASVTMSDVTEPTAPAPDDAELPEQMRVRREKLDRLQAQGTEGYALG